MQQKKNSAYKMAISQPPKLGLTSSYANEIFTQTSAEQTSHIKQNQKVVK